MKKGLNKMIKACILEENIKSDLNTAHPTAEQLVC